MNFIIFCITLGFIFGIIVSISLIITFKVKEYKRKSTTLSKTFEYKELLVLKFPGIVYSDNNMFSKYSLKIYEPLYSTVFTPPRGYVDKSSVVVIGVAPGWSHLSFGEPNWLYGPSSKTLHEMLGFDYRWYITNVSKEPFFKNRYNGQACRP